jgi:hypothetical protein
MIQLGATDQVRRGEYNKHRRSETKHCRSTSLTDDSPPNDEESG